MNQTQTPPQITTVIPTFRRPHLVGRAVRSVLAQSYPYFEVCVYDNASGDATREVMEQLVREDKRVKYYCQADNIGPWSNFAFGMSRVRTPFFNLLSDDDALLPNFFEDALEALNLHPEAILFAGATVRFAPGFIDTPVLSWPEGLYPAPRGFIEILRRDFPDWNAILFRQEAIEVIGGLDVTYEEAIDLEFVCRCAAQRAIYVSPTPHGILTVGHVRLGSTIYSPARYVAVWQTILNHFADAAWVDEEVRAAFGDARSWVARVAFKQALRFVMMGKPEVARDTAERLESDFKMRALAAVLRQAAASSLAGEMIRAAVRSTDYIGKSVVSKIRANRNRPAMPSVLKALQLPP